MDFELTAAQTAFAETVRRFALAKLKDGALDRAHALSYPWDIARMLAEQGLLGITIPEKDGGMGGTLMDAVIAIQEVALVCPKSADIVQAGNFGAIRTFAEYATRRTEGALSPRPAGRAKADQLGMTEPDAGSAVTDLRTAAQTRRRRLRHQRQQDLHHAQHRAAAVPHLCALCARRGRHRLGAGRARHAGFTIGKPSSFMSGEQWCPLYFDNCRIPSANVLLGEGGFKKQIAGFNVERIGNAARALALGRHAFNVARDYAQERKQFGRPLCEFQGLQWKFAEMAVKLDAAQLLLYRAIANAEDGLPSAYDTAVAKLACNLAGFEVANEALQVMGGMGYSKESLVEYCVRRTRGWMIAGGSIEILKNRIAETIFDRRFDQRKG